MEDLEYLGFVIKKVGNLYHVYRGKELLFNTDSSLDSAKERCEFVDSLDSLDKLF